MARRVFDRMEIFQELPAAVRRSVAMQCRWKKYEPGEIIVRRGDPDSSLLLLAEGQAQVFAPSGEESGKTLRLIQQGETFGEVAALDGGPRWATVVARDYCLVAEMPSDLLWGIIEARPRVTAELLKKLVKSLRDVSPGIIALASQF